MRIRLVTKKILPVIAVTLGAMMVPALASAGQDAKRGQEVDLARWRDLGP